MRNASRILFLFVCGVLTACAATPVSAQTASNLSSRVDDGQTVAATDWPWWRGPLRDGTASAHQQVPLTWSESDNIAWKTPVPGRGHGSPIVVGSRIYLATADRERDLQSVLCFDKTTGKQVWETVVHQGGLMQKNKKASQASSTLAWDGERLFINFLNDAAIYTTALDRDGKQLWQEKVGDYVIHQGYGASPTIYQDLVFVAADNKGGGVLAALNRTTGEMVWRRERPKLPNYPSPTVLKVAGKDQLIMTGCKLVSSFEPLTGKLNWEIAGATEECVTSTVTDGTHVYSSGGYPDNHIAAIKADGSGEIVWQNRTRVYVPSMLIKDGFLYGVLDAGVASCWNAATGKEQWKARLGGDFTSSPVLVGDRIYATNEVGTTFVYKSSPTEFELLAKNSLDGDSFATPTICDGKILLRIGRQEDDKRQEYLYCIE